MLRIALLIAVAIWLAITPAGGYGIDGRLLIVFAILGTFLLPAKHTAQKEK